jgi:flagellar biosynthesis/type III secretory pathway protein FliH
VGRVVKGPGHVVPGAVLDARAEAQAALADARATLARAETEAVSIRAQAHREGYAQGRAEAAAEAAALLAAARAEAARGVVDAAAVAATLAAKMAAKIVGRAVALHPETMAEIAAAALAAVRPRDTAVTLRLNPDDLPAVAARKETLAARAPAATEIALVADEAVDRHGCIVETAHGRVDARLETQLAALEQAILRGGR